MSFEKFDLIEEKVTSLIREVLSLREENTQLQSKISILQKKLKENKKRLEHVLVSESEIQKLYFERQKVQEKVSQMLNQLQDL